MSPIVPEDDLVVDDPFSRAVFGAGPGSVADQTRARREIIVPRGTSTPRESEADITKKSIRWLKRQPATYAWKLFGSVMGETGHPDIDGCTGGRSIKIEMKRPGERPTAHQMARLRQWRETGAIVGWASSVEQVQQLVTYAKQSPEWRNPLTGPGTGFETTTRP